MRLPAFTIMGLCLVLTSAAQPFNSFYKPGHLLTVHATAGLSLRSKPDVQSKVLVVVPLGGKVEVLQDKNPPVAFESSGIPGHWVFVKYNDMQGYQFDGFLSRFPVFNEKGLLQPGIEPGNAVAEYLKALYQVKQETTKQPADEQGDYRIWNVVDFTNGIHFLEKDWTSYWLEIEFPEKWFSYHEVFLLGREVWPSLFSANGCPYDDDGILCEQSAPQYLRINHDKGVAKMLWYVSD